MDQTHVKDAVKKYDWGRELSWAEGDNYRGKIIVFEK